MGRLWTFFLILGGLSAQDEILLSPIETYRRAVALNPNSTEAHLRLGNALRDLIVLAATSPFNPALFTSAESEFKTVLALDPQNKTAVNSLGSLALDKAQANFSKMQPELEIAAGWYRQLIEFDPQKKDAFYRLGIIDWLKWFPAYQAARASLNTKPEPPGSVAGYNTRRDLRLRFEPIIEDGIWNLQKALDIDPKYDDAMAYMNLFLRERADLHDTAAEYETDIAAANAWVQKALDTKKEKAPSASSPNPHRFRVGGNVEAPQLVRKITPRYPAEAKSSRTQGTVRFIAVIGADGHVMNLELLSGEPVLAEAALPAVQQWIYKPILLNGQPVEVLTEIDVNFTLAENVASGRLMRIPAAEQASSLLYTVDPVYPPLAFTARIQGTVRFTAMIDTSGRVKNVQLVSGHPLLIESARTAVLGYVYKPYLDSSGQGMEVVTQIDVNFVLPLAR